MWEGERGGSREGQGGRHTPRTITRDRGSWRTAKNNGPAPPPRAAPPHTHSPTPPLRTRHN